MAVTGIYTTQKAASASATSDEVTYEAPYRIKVSDAGDGPGTIFTYLRTNGPWIGATFSYGNDSDASATLREWSSPRREPGSDGVWLATAKYSTKQQGSDAKPSQDTGELTDWPLDWRPEVDVSWAGHEEPAYKAVYRAGFSHDPALFTAGQSYAPQNSALEIYDPPLMRDRSRATFQCKMWRQYYNFDTAQKIIDLVNMSPVKFPQWIPIIGTMAAYSLKVADVRGHHRRESRENKQLGMRVVLDYYEIIVELQWRRDGWRDKVVDRGYRKIVLAGDDDGFGGTISGASLIAGDIPPNRAIVDAGGIANQTPVLLNGNGFPKAATDRSVTEITWSKYDEESYATQVYLLPFLEPA